MTTLSFNLEVNRDVDDDGDVGPITADSYMLFSKRWKALSETNDPGLTLTYDDSRYINMVAGESCIIAQGSDSISEFETYEEMRRDYIDRIVTNFERFLEENLAFERDGD